MLERIYFDHNATTPIDRELKSYLSSFIESWGNPSSIYSSAREPKKILRETRQKFAEILNCHPLEIIFTSGGSESNNLAIKGLLSTLEKNKKDTLITSSVEHPSVLKSFEYLSAKGWKIIHIPVDKNGQLDLEFYKKSLTENKVGLVSIMCANNETGVIHPTKDLCALAHEHGAYYHCDAVQYLGKYKFDFKEMNVDLASFSSHKFYALKGSGALYCRKGIQLESLIHGGGQERSRRAGTENVLAIASLGFMLNKIDQVNSKINEIGHLRDLFESELLKKISKIEITAQNQSRLSNTSHMIVYGASGENLLMNLDLKGYEVSTGAACSAGSPEPSPALLAMGYDRSQAQSSLRVSFGKDSTQKQVLEFVKVLEEVIPHLRSIN